MPGWAEEEKKTTEHKAEKKQKHDFLVVLDFEATCERDDRSYVNEIIEFPSVLVCTRTLKIVAEFQQYVRPQKNKTLTAFCTSLTGIEQKTVENGVSFPSAFKSHQEWIKEKVFGGGARQDVSFLFVTCGNWDLRTMLPKQLTMTPVKFPKMYKTWCNIKIPFVARYLSNSPKRKQRWPGMAGMLRQLSLKLQGRHHSGIDDCRNIARIAIRMMRDGVVFTHTAETRWRGSG